MNEPSNASIMLLTITTPAASFSPTVTNSPGHAEIMTMTSQEVPTTWQFTRPSGVALSGVDLSVSGQPGGVDLFIERVAEIDWLDAHPNRAAQLAGEWIALAGDELVGHGRDLAAVLQQATRAGHPHPFITKAPDVSTIFVF